MQTGGQFTAFDLVVALDYGQFHLVSKFDPPPAPEDEIDAVRRAIDGDGIAQCAGLLVVLSPHQNNFEMPFRIELWPTPPPDDAEQWQEAHEAPLDVDDGGIAYTSPTGDVVDLPIPPGSYQARITGRGFVGWPGSTTPGDEWRLQLWASAERTGPRRVKRFQ